MSELIRALSDWLWGPPMLALVVGVGLYLVVRFGAVQVRFFVSAWRALATKSKGDGDITPFAALMTAVGGIVGNGNIAGVATAVTAGGPGALFWMWVSGALGMGTMFAESALGVKYRTRGPDGVYVGGPMYYLRDRLGWPKVAVFFALGLGTKTLLATTTVQSNSIASVAKAELGLDPFVTCMALAIVTALAIMGGVRSIARVSQFLCPVMGVLYLAGAFTVLAMSWREIPAAFALVFEHAFSPISATGGFLGAGVREAFRYGMARGVYSNEAGTGSVPIAHASARTNDPIQQGKIAMLGVFLDTLVVCTATGLVILVTGAWTAGGLDSAALTAHAFSVRLGAVGGPVVLIASVLFGLSTLISWAFYGEQCTVFLAGPQYRRLYRAAYCVAILGGSLAGAQVIWAWGDLLNGLMAIPNLIAVAILAKEVARTMREKRA